MGGSHREQLGKEAGDGFALGVNGPTGRLDLAQNRQLWKSNNGDHGKHT